MERGFWRAWIFSVVVCAIGVGHELPLRPLALGQTRRFIEAYYDPSECRNPGPAQFAESRRLLTALLNRVVSENPETFRGLPNLCIGVEDYSDPILYAESFPQFGLIQFSTHMILAARTAAELAAIVSHEAAHITLQHYEAQLGNERSPWWPAHLRAVRARREEFRLTGIEERLTREIRALRRDHPEDEEGLRALRRQKWETHDRLVDASVDRARELRRVEELQAAAYHPDFITRWREQEADLVGYELYLRAGFGGREFTWFFQRNALHDDLNLIDRLTRDLIDLPLFDLQTSRFTASVERECSQPNAMPTYAREELEGYPTYCWRVWNARQNLGNYRERLERAPTTSPAFDSLLADAKRELTAWLARPTE